MHSMGGEGSARAAAFRPVLGSLRNNLSRPISSTRKIKLPITVKTNVNILRMIEYIRPAGTNETAVYVTLEAPEDGHMVSAGVKSRIPTCLSSYPSLIIQNVDL